MQLALASPLLLIEFGHWIQVSAGVVSIGVVFIGLLVRHLKLALAGQLRGVEDKIQAIDGKIQGIEKGILLAVDAKYLTRELAFAKIDQMDGKYDDLKERIIRLEASMGRLGLKE
jgi:hypothetical protein